MAKKKAIRKQGITIAKKISKTAIARGGVKERAKKHNERMMNINTTKGKRKDYG